MGGLIRTKNVYTYMCASVSAYVRENPELLHYTHTNTHTNTHTCTHQRPNAGIRWKEETERCNERKDVVKEETERCNERGDGKM